MRRGGVFVVLAAVAGAGDEGYLFVSNRPGLGVVVYSSSGCYYSAVPQVPTR